MRLEYGFELSQVEVPRFSVEAVEGIGKLFTLATLVLNVLEIRSRVEIVFHGLNPEDPEALNNLGQVMVRSGRVEEAIALFDRAIGYGAQPIVRPLQIRDLIGIDAQDPTARGIHCR